MNNYKKVSSYIVIIAIALAAYFIYNKDTAKNINVVKNTVSDNSQTDTRTVIEKTASSSTDFYNMSISYPKDILDKNNEIEKLVNDLVDKKKEQWKTGGNDYRDWQALIKEYPERKDMKNEFDVTYSSSTSQKLGVNSYIINTYEYTGGAHGGSKLYTFNFNKNGIIKIDDVLNIATSTNNIPNDISISKIIATGLTKFLGDYADEKMINDGLGLSYLKKDGKTLDKTKCNCDGFFYGSNLQNFILQNDGIKFIFDQYSVAAYAAGQPETVIKWKDLAPFVNKSFGLPLD